MEERRKKEGGRGKLPSSGPLPPSPERGGVGIGAIVAAAGGSTRMAGPSTSSLAGPRRAPVRGQAGQALDKLFAHLAGRPLLAHVLGRLQGCRLIHCIVLVVSSANLQRGRDLVAEYGIDKASAVCPGGPRRQDSVRMGLDALGACDWVLVQDGARLLIEPVISRGLEAAQETGAAVAAVPIADTVKMAGADGTVERTLERSRLWAVQTPQVFRYEILVRAHREVTADVTDDAAMLEVLGLPVKLYPGSPLNMKVTSPEDLRLAEALLQGASASVSSEA